MRLSIVILIVCFGAFLQQINAQENDSTLLYKQKVLESIEVDMLMSYYTQEGTHSAVGGGIGTEELSDGTPTIVVKVPLNADDVLTFDVGISAYTSASSSNINPFNTGASQGEDEDEYEDNYSVASDGPTGSPWVASSGASRSDVLAAGHISYAHQSDDRNFIWGLNGDVSNEYDYTSIGFGGQIARLFNDKNTEVGLKGQVYLDTWRPIYPTELHEYERYGSSFLNQGYFSGVNVLNLNGAVTSLYHPDDFSSISDGKRNSYSMSLSFSQILSKRFQASFFLDFIQQSGLLSTPYHRMYFADKEDYFIGEAADIPDYTSPTNRGVFHLADDIERMPDTRFKIPVGARINYYISNTFVLRSYYRYYQDDWGMDGHTMEIELPVRLFQGFSVTPAFRYYTQTAVDYFAGYEQHLSTEQYYTSDYDLASFNSNQYGLGLSYTDIFTKLHVSMFGMKNIWTKFSHYDRSDGLSANIISFGVRFVMD
jgi:hypothetical protein